MDDLSPAAKARKLYERAFPLWRPLHESYEQKRAFLAGDRYEDNSDWANRDRRLVQIRGQETFDTVRHIAAETTANPRNLQPRAIDHHGDAQSGEVMTSLVEMQLNDPYKAFDRYYYEAVVSARVAGLGVVWMDWEKDFGPYGEIFFNYDQPENYMWDAPYDPHHPKCGWLIRQNRMDVDEARDRYGAKWLEPDNYRGRVSAGRADTPLLSHTGVRTMVASYDDDKVTIQECWYKNDKSPKYRENGKAAMMPKDMRYLSCVAGCGYRSPTQGELETQGNAQELPEYLEQGCADCGGDLDRIDSYAQEETIHAFNLGKRMTIYSPFCVGKDDGAIYDGGWPIPRARSFPGLFLVAYIEPGQPVGPSDVTQAWDQQIASDQLRTLAVQRVFEHRGVWVISRDGIVDTNGRRFENRDDQEHIALRDMSNASNFGVPTIEHINPTGLDPSFPIVFQTTQAALTQYGPKADFGLTQESSKNIAVGTIETLERQGNIALEDFKRRCSHEVGKFAGVVSDYVRATLTPQRVSRLKIEGVELLANVWGDDFPNYDFVIEDAPAWTGTEKAQAEQLQFLEQVAMRSPHLVSLYAKVMKFAPSLVQEFEEAMAQAKAEAAQMQQQQADAEAQETELDVNAELEAAEMGLDPSALALEASGFGMQGPAQ